jgi:diadenosine tetraphosphate (Ap4A) HIT family hydrolase
MTCIFCEKAADESQHVGSNQHAFAVRDGYPISPGHTLVIPRHHIPNYFNIPVLQMQAALYLLDNMKIELDKEFRPDAYNVGINCGVVAGQTVDHAHIHLIPRYKGDVEDPRGGVRWTIPHKARYW